MTTVLREGYPIGSASRRLSVSLRRPRCAQTPTTIQWFRELSEGKPPTINRVGISYVLLGESGADFDHPERKEPPEGQDWYHAGPHVMFVFPAGTGGILQGLGRDTNSGLPYARPIPGAEPLLVVPVARPGESICACPSDCECCASHRSE
jgi:hypothetical protein